MSLRARLLGLVLMAVLLPALLLAARFIRDSQAEIKTAVAALAASADSASVALEQRVQGTAQLHFGLAHSRLLDDADPATCSSYLAQVREAYPQYTGIISVLPDGRMKCDSLRSGQQLNVSDRSYFKRVMAGENGLILAPAIGRLTGKSVLQIVYPARSESGLLRFMLVASLNLMKFAQDARRQMSAAGPELLLIDEKGTVLAWTGAKGEVPEIGASIEGSAIAGFVQSHPRGGTAELTAPGGQAQIWALATPPAAQALGLRVLLGQPQQALVANSKLRLRQGLIVLSGAALLLFAGVWWLTERGIRRPIERITTMVRELGGGNLSARIALPYPRGEMGGLMAVLNTTAESLQQQRQAITELGGRLKEAHQREITDREQNEARLSRMANFDGLTGLPNRTLFRDRLQQAMDRARRSEKPFALMFLDVDRFKNINDSLGHEVGDGLLVAISRVLTTCLRASDSVAIAEGDSVAEPEREREGVFRLGGDEFMILAEDVSGLAPVAQIAERILEALTRPYTVGEHELFISASIGITLFTADDTDLDGLIKQADLAMYRSKELGRDTYCFFDEKLNQQAGQRHQMEMGLRHALERKEFVLHYQPKAELGSGRITGVEALLRWQPEGQPMVGPDQFIPVLEETGLIMAVGAWVLREACAQAVAWQQQGLPPIDLAVNLSARQFRQANLVGEVAGILASTGLDAKRLEVELTESLLIDDSEVVRNIMQGLGGLGVRIAIDDFGTGESSLRYLKRFNVDTLKIDRSFVKDTPDDVEDSAITAAVIALGQSLGLNVVAEGVETQAQVDFLKSKGCHQYQGYLLSRPLTAEAFARWFAQHQIRQPETA